MFRNFSSAIAQISFILEKQLSWYTHVYSPFQAFVIKKGSKSVHLPYLPLRFHLSNGQTLRLESYRAKDHENAIFPILKDAVDAGQTYPQDSMETLDDFRAYYISHDAFVAVEEDTGEAVGSFYVKPNFPGRCSHVSNAGFLVRKDRRGRGIGGFLARAYLHIARDLGYKSSLFNLVFVSNAVSQRMCKTMGCIEVGRLPEVGDLKGIGFTDAIMYYRELSTVPSGLPEGMIPVKNSGKELENNDKWQSFV